MAGTSDRTISYIWRLGIAEAVLFLWKEHFETNPFYEHITTLLLFRGSEQQGWFLKADHKLPITEVLSNFKISSSESPGWTTIGLHSSEIFEVNKRAVVCISNAIALWGGGRGGEDSPGTHMLSSNIQ